MSNRVEIPVYTDRWMMGDRYGTVVKHSVSPETGRTVLHVQLDKSGRTVKVVSDDCKDI